MRHLIERADGGVSIMTLLPVAALLDIDGEARVVPILRTKGTLLIVRDDGAFITASENGLPIEDLKPDSYPGLTLVFPDPLDEAKKSGLEAISCTPIEAADIPQDRTYRNAWVKSEATITHDMTKARDIHRDNLRTLRAPKFVELDTAYMRADEAGDAAAKIAIAKQKQVLRDATKDPAIEAALTVDQLKAVIPSGLVGG